MTAAAKTKGPGEQAFSSRLKQIESRGVFGLREQWDVPAALWCAPTGFDARYPEDVHATSSMVLGGEPVERLDGRFSGRSGGPEPDLFMLYPGDDVFEKSGKVQEYGPRQAGNTPYRSCRSENIFNGEFWISVPPEGSAMHRGTRLVAPFFTLDKWRRPH